jgi:hypothetical protein
VCGRSSLSAGCPDPIRVVHQIGAEYGNILTNYESDDTSARSAVVPSWSGLTFIVVGVNDGLRAGVAREIVVFVVEPGRLNSFLTRADPPLLSGGRAGSSGWRRSGSLSERAGKDGQKGDSGEERFSRREHGVRGEYSDFQVSEGEGSVLCS